MDYIIYFGVTILILVFVHELGHFVAAKMCKMRVDIFAIGFGKRLIGWNKKTGFSTGSLPKDFDGEAETDYRLCVLPLGGYVKIAGMVDESFDTKFKDLPPKPDEFRAKPTYQKLFVITAGVMMNLILAIGIFAGINFFKGKQVAKTTTVGYLAENSPALQAGFAPNDEIVSVNGNEVNNWDEVVNQLLFENFGNELKIDVIRNGEKKVLTIPHSTVVDNSEEGFFLPFAFWKPSISVVVENSPAEEAGFKSNDIFLSLNNIPVKRSSEAIEIISSHSYTEIPVILLRGSDTVKTMVTPGADGKIGIIIQEAYTGPIEFKTYGFFSAIGQSFNNIEYITTLTFTMFKKVIAGDAELGKTFGGPVKIADMAVQSAERGIEFFLNFLAMLSLSLAIINIMPFPVLDGGHFVIILIEGILKKELPIKIKIAIQNTGFVLLLMLMVFIIYNDIINL
jgi:regulator of sigma E protease